MKAWRDGPWWETRGFALAAILISMVPLLWPAVPPLADLPGHIGRYHIAAEIGRSPDLARHWDFHWALIGNLGVDLLAYALSPVLAAEDAAKLVVLAIPPLWVSGLLLLSRASGGRFSPAAGFAFPLAYAFPFQMGFVNFMLAAALALHALVLWIHLGRRDRLILRALLFAPIALILWTAHSFGWGMFGLLAFSTELVRLRRRAGWLRAIGLAGVQCVPLALPLPLMLGGTSGGGLAPLWDWKAKASWFPSLLRERWKWYDVACAALLFGLCWAALRDRRMRFDAVLGASALCCLLAFVALPRLMIGGAYVDMRMLAPAVGLALAGIRVAPGCERLIATAAAAFFALRTLTSTVAMLLFAQAQGQALGAVTHIPRGAAVLVLVNEPCSSQWRSDRLGHIAGLAIARRDIFENGQWALGGQQLVRPRHPGAEPYRADPSQLVYPARCEYRTTDFHRAVRDFDRGTFDHVWTLGFPASSRLAPDLVLIWSNRSTALYRVAR